MARSMLPPQLRHSTFAVSVMRAIVMCEPQLGQSERSSKRWRQYTQRNRPGRFVGLSHGSPHDGHDGRGMVLVDSIASVFVHRHPPFATRAMKKPSVP